MRHEEKEGKLSDFLCSCSAAVLARSRSHYLCIRKNLSAQRPSRFDIKNSKWKIQPHQHETWKPGSEERTKEKPYLSDHPKAQTAKRHVPQERQWGRRFGTEMFDSYEVFIPLSLLHDDGEEPTINQDF